MSSPTPGSPHSSETLAAVTYVDGDRVHRPLSLPADRATTFQVESATRHAEMFGEGEVGVYQRFGHPMTEALAQRLALIEGAEAAVVFGSGMGAITGTLLALLHAGDHVVAAEAIFAQTKTVLESLLPRMGVRVTFVDATDSAALSAAARPDTKVVYIETPSNPMLRIVDIAAAATVARNVGALLAVDSTFASPVLQNPIALGADLVFHSATKFLGGHSDVMAGVVLGPRAVLDEVTQMQILVGSVLDPTAAWLLLRSLRTLHVRVRAQTASALTIARFLEAHPKVRRVYYPWLDGSPGYHVARSQMRGGGGVVSFEVVGGVKRARCFCDALRLIPIATSLGGVETLVELPFDLDFCRPDPTGEWPDGEENRGATVRLSVGLETVDDLIEDLEQALSQA